MQFECLAGAILSENTYRLVDDLTEQTASELHNYYVYEMRLTNYAPRLAKLIKLVDGAEVKIFYKK